MRSGRVDHAPQIGGIVPAKVGECVSVYVKKMASENKETSTKPAALLSPSISIIIGKDSSNDARLDAFSFLSG